VGEGALETFDRRDEIPPVLSQSISLSVRAYDGEDMMVDAEVVPGAEARRAIERLLAKDDVGYLHVHFAPRGCYLARVDRE
jgi:hypothetical protein